MTDLYITGAGVSAQSGIPTFRGSDGFWTVGSKNYTPQQMATRWMYEYHCAEFLSWYYHRFIRYRHCQPNDVHYWLADKHLITQNIDALDAKAGNDNYLAVHGRIDKLTIFYDEQDTYLKDIELIAAPWQDIETMMDDSNDKEKLNAALLDAFNINHVTKVPILNQSLKPFVLLFDEYYSEVYGIFEAQQRMQNASRMIFMGTSFSVNITNMALEIAMKNKIPVDIVDPNPVKIPYKYVSYHQQTASEFIQN